MSSCVHLPGLSVPAPEHVLAEVESTCGRIGLVRGGRMVAALNISGQANRTSPQLMQETMLPALLQSAASAAVRRVSGDYWTRTTHAVLADCTADPKLASVLAGQWGDYGTPPKRSK